MQINVATLFDKNYLVRALAFYNSLKEVGNYKFWFLCIDQETKEVMGELNLPDTTFITIDEIGDKELLETKENRNFPEFVFTSKSVWVNYILDKLPDGEALMFDDCDLFYFAAPGPILDKMRENNNSIGIVPHRFPKNKEYMNEKVGKYNAGLLYLIADKNSRQCIRDWRKQCIEWCYLKYEKDRFGDQLYMNRWPNQYRGVYEIPDKGINVGSWSLSDFKLSRRGSLYFVDGEPLICYHFHRIKFYIDKNIVKPLPIYVFNRGLYQHYTNIINESWVILKELEGDWKYGFVEKPNFLRMTKQKIHKTIRNLIYY